MLNNAISSVDQALWDIKGRQAGMPVYQVLGGKHREAADTYGHAAGRDVAETIASAKQYMSRGFRHVRVQVGIAGMAGYGAGRGDVKLEALHNKPMFEPQVSIRAALKLFEACRKELGDEIELLHLGGAQFHRGARDRGGVGVPRADEVPATAARDRFQPHRRPVAG